MKCACILNFHLFVFLVAVQSGVCTSLHVTRVHLLGPRISKAIFSNGRVRLDALSCLSISSAVCLPFFFLTRALVEHFLSFCCKVYVGFIPDSRVVDPLAFLFSLMPTLRTTSSILNDGVYSAAQDCCSWDHFSLACLELHKTIVCMIVNTACLIF